MDKVPTISVIIPAFQAEDTIGRCLNSLFAQSFQDFEVIAVNDGSTDQTREILRTYEPRIRVIDQENCGSNPARNRGAREARGIQFLFLDADIVMHQDCLRRMWNALEKHSDVSYVYVSFQYGKKFFWLWPFDEKRLRNMPYIPTSSLMRAKDFPGFDENVKRLQDWDLWLTMLEKGRRGMWIPEILFSVTPRKDGISRWVPRWFFWIPWAWFGWMPERVRSYQNALRLIQEKHGLVKSRTFFIGGKGAG